MDRTLLDQCLGMVDAIFWNGNMYDCAINRKAVDQVLGLMKWGVQMEDMIELNEMLQD